MRVLISSVLILDILIRISDLKAHYTNDGVLPLNVLFESLWHEWFISFHTISSNWYFQLALFLIELFFAITLLIGFKTKLSTVISWIFLLSVHNRNPLILQGGDDLLRMTLFWAMFLPWGDYYSLDSKTKPSGSKLVFSAATIGFVIQVAAVYFFSALLKTSPEWRSESTALYYALSLDQLAMPMGKLIYPYESMLKIMTFIVFRLELFIPLLLFIPVFNKQFRNICAIAFICFHIGIGLTLFVGLFFLIGIATATGLFSGNIADKIHEFIQTKLGIQDSETISERPVKHKLITQSFLSAMIFYTLAWNASTVEETGIRIPADLRIPAYALRSNQNWGMFSPAVFKDDGWLIFEATTLKGELIDLNRFGKKVDYRKPESVVSLFRNDRWRKFSENYLFVSNAYLRPYYCNFILNEWNKENPSKAVSSLKIVYMKEVSRPGYLHDQPRREVLSEVND